jgi:CubicO group peptidase (beta-lactamase class C family)
MAASLGVIAARHQDFMNRTKATILTATCVAFLFTACHSNDAAPLRCAPTPPASDATTTALSQILTSAKNKHAVGALIFTAEQHGKPIYRVAVGDSTPGVAATTEMHFRIGGVGWEYLGMVLLRAVDAGQLSLTDLVSTWYPTYPNADKTTVEMLAVSSCGYGDYVNSGGFLAKLTADPQHVWTTDEILAWSVPPHQAEQFSPPGSDWAYSHTCFVMLGGVLEKATGKPYAQLLQEQVLAPLGYTDTRFQLDTVPQEPVLHTIDKASSTESTYWNPSWSSYAAMTSNICELGAWVRAYGEGQLLSPAGKRELDSVKNTGHGENTASRYYGVGSLVFTPWRVATASYWGMVTTGAYDPTTGIAIAVTASLTPSSGDATLVANEIVKDASKLLTPDHPVAF